MRDERRVDGGAKGLSAPKNDDALTRRTFLGCVGGLTTAAVAAGVGVPGCVPVIPPDDGTGPEKSCAVSPQHGADRVNAAFQLRIDAAQRQRDAEHPDVLCNGDEERYADKIASYSKGLPHNQLGEVDLAAYDSLMQALHTGDPSDFERIALGSTAVGREWFQKLVNPQAGLAFELEGMDPQHPAIAPAPTFDSAEEAGEIVENYWMALLRDVPFHEYATHPLAQSACDDLSRLTDFRGPKVNGRVTPDTLFRGFTPGDLVGPYVSQFLLRPAPLGSQYIEQRMRTTAAGVDFMTDYAEWLAVQNGRTPSLARAFETDRRYVTTGRDLSEWVHIDQLYQAYFNACLILGTPPDADLLTGGIGAPLNPGNPYNDSATQIGFGTFGGPYIKTIVTEVATRALKAVWCTKWLVHRRLRPEMFAGRMHNHLSGAASYPIHEDALNSAALDEVWAQHGSYLLPMAFPEGCPLHPAYGAGHATVAGACVTVLKALFDETFEIPNPLVPDSNDPAQLVPYPGPPLTVGNELNKLAANIAVGRDHAGVHWRSDYTESLKLGEAVAISVLADQRLCYNEDFNGFTFTRFDGTVVTV